MGQSQPLQVGDYDLDFEQYQLINDAKSRKTIRIVNKNLREIRPEIFTLLKKHNIKELTSICISNSKLSNLPEFLFSEILNTNLESLDFTSNFIENIPKEIEQFVKLERLYFSGNKLKTLPIRFIKTKI
jgi:Leucine-rich repeat (LRR) protein